jgi:hypothetical protein
MSSANNFFITAGIQQAAITAENCNNGKRGRYAGDEMRAVHLASFIVHFLAADTSFHLRTHEMLGLTSYWHTGTVEPLKMQMER